MLGKENRQELKCLMQISIGGVVTKSDLKEWLLGLQKQNPHFCGQCETKDLEIIAKELNIKVVVSKGEYNKICHKYKCFYSIPKLYDPQTEAKKETVKNKLTSEDAKNIKRMYWDENKPAIEICSIYGIGTQTFYKFLRKNGISFKLNVERNRGKITPKDVLICQELKKQGKTYKEIAELYGVTRQYMQEKLQKKRFDIYKENARLNKELEIKENEIIRLKEMLNLKEAM